MTDTVKAPPTFITIERPRKGNGEGHHEFINKPDFFHTVNPEMAEFIYKANLALKTFRNEWRAEHDGWAQDLELDLIPIMSSEMVTGYLVISEIDGESYDYAPAVALENADGEEKS